MPTHLDTRALSQVRSSPTMRTLHNLKHKSGARLEAGSAAIIPPPPADAAGLFCGTRSRTKSPSANRFAVDFDCDLRRRILYLEFCGKSLGKSLI